MRSVMSWLTRGPRFSVSIQIRDTPDLLCHLTVSNPGPPFELKTARLLRPRIGLIYRREQFLSDDIEGSEFTELRLDRAVGPGETIRIPFEVWIPRTHLDRGIRLLIRTDRRLWPYRSLIADRHVYVEPSPDE